MSDDDLDAKIATIEAELGLDLSGTGNEVIDASPPSEAADHLAGSAGTLREYLDERDHRVDLERRVREAEARIQQQQQKAAADVALDALNATSA
jgi:hypothetical protein